MVESLVHLKEYITHKPLPTHRLQLNHALYNGLPGQMNSATLVLSLIFIITLKNLSNKFVASLVDGILIKHIY